MTYRTRRIAVAVVAVLSLLGAACSSEPQEIDTSQGDGIRLGGKNKADKGKAGGGSKSNGAGATGGGSGNGKGKASGGGGTGATAGGGGGGGAGGGGGSSDVPAPPPGSGGGSAATADKGFASQGPPSPVDPSLARRSSLLDDPSTDAKKEGALVPAHGELLGAGVQGVGEQFEMRFTFGGSVPDKMPDKNTIMVIGFGISAGGNDTYGFTAQGTQEGWKAYAGAKDGAKRFPGEFLIQGDTITMRVPWKFINGPREFRWQANSTWFRTVANTTHYSFDQCPNEKAAQFPS